MAKSMKGFFPLALLLFAGSNVAAKGCVFTDDVSLGDGEGGTAAGLGGASGKGGANSSGGKPTTAVGGNTGSSGGRATAEAGAPSAGGSSSGGRSGTGGTSSSGGLLGIAGEPDGGIGGAPPGFVLPEECKLPLLHESCALGYAAWGFDESVGACVQYPEDDCGNNANWFKERQECEAKCLPPVDPTPTEDPCNQPIDVGPCDAAIPRYAYVAASNSCVPFSYGGCGGNLNNFALLSDCELTCGIAYEESCLQGGSIAAPVRGDRYDAANQCWEQHVYVDCIGLLPPESTIARGCMRRLRDNELFDTSEMPMPKSRYRECSAAERELLLGLPACE